MKPGFVPTASIQCAARRLTLARPGNDDFQFDDLGGVDLSKLDLDHIELDIDRPRSPWWRWVALVALLGMGGFIIWFPQSATYQSFGYSSGVFFLVCVLATVVGVAGGRWLWAWVRDATVRYVERPVQEERPPSALGRWLTLAFVVLGIVIIVFWLPSSGLISGSAVSGVVFGAAAIAIVVGISLGRWLLLQAEASAKKVDNNRPPIRLPPWFKWVTLAALVLIGLFALVAPWVVDDAADQSMQFGLGGVGFAVGVAAAIWLARRFDETEERIRRQGRR
ncbi:MAG: hypothetical protein A2341_20665 [Deltaproteobacteria bacterium RIFOXYB12_FULL_58_9]|nr:MAG: hypothetical protein A2341_20665 [Deltaproteobacteria bacterium RIFOXYB12_FULL_58_9]